MMIDHPPATPRLIAAGFEQETRQLFYDALLIPLGFGALCS